MFAAMRMSTTKCKPDSKRKWLLPNLLERMNTRCMQVCTEWWLLDEEDVTTRK